MTRMKTFAALALVAASALLPGCRTNAGTGSLIGAGLGAGLGSMIGNNNRGGHNHGRTAAGALLGAGVGALAGYMIGNEADKEQRGTHYEGDPRYEPGYEEPRGGERRTYYVQDDGPPRERVIYRERTVYEDDCRHCR